MTAEQLAELFHETYERLAPDFGYETRPETALEWQDIPAENKNKQLMIAVAGELLNRKSPNRTYIDAATGFKLVFEWTILDPQRVTLYAPENARSLTDEQCNQAVQRLIHLAHAAEVAP